MTREQFLDLVRHPEHVVSAPAESIASLTNQFPYCQPLRYLYLKQLAGTDSVQYPQQLKITAALAPDRTRLFRLIHPEPDGPTSEDVMAGVYESASAPTAESATEVPVTIFEHVTAATSQELPEYDVPEDESKMSVEEIVNQRLKELNLWQEPEDTTAAVESSATTESTFSNEVPAFEETIGDTDAETTPEVPTIPFTHELQPAPSLEIRAEEEIPTPVEVEHQPADEDRNPPVADAPIINEPDPLDEIIRESIVETRLRNSEYFSGPETPYIPELPAADVAIPPAAPVDITPAATLPAPEQYATHTSEIHSFTDWLKLNHGPLPEEQGMTETAEPEKSTLTQEVSADSYTPAAIHTPEPSAATVLSKDDTTGPLTAGLSEVQPEAPTAIPSGQQAPPTAAPVTSSAGSVAQVRFIFVKSGMGEPTPPPAPVSPLPVYNAPVADISLVAPPAPLPAATSPAETEPAEEEMSFTEEVIPPRKPIPDPSLVDTDPPKPRVPASELIEKFIREEPRISPSKSTFYSPSNMAKKSILEPDDLVTETLASIYAQQGNFKKAISFYQKLSLKFPEKSRYFAALIEELKKKSNI